MVEKFTLTKAYREDIEELRASDPVAPMFDNLPSAEEWRRDIVELLLFLAHDNRARGEGEARIAAIAEKWGITLG